jgi:hypothetical protein
MAMVAKPAMEVVVAVAHRPFILTTALPLSPAVVVAAVLLLREGRPPSGSTATATEAMAGGLMANKE